MISSKTILIVEDEGAIADNVIYSLEAEGFKCEWLSLACEAITRIKGGGVDLVILDVGLPDVNGFEACKEIRAFSRVPIIFLTARSSEIDRVVGLEIGADDYVTKPFSTRELSARVKARLRQHEIVPVLMPTKLNSNKQFYIDDSRKTICFLGTELHLTAYEYGVLQHLLSDPERVFSREQLMSCVRDMPEVALERSIDTHIKSLRSKMKEVDSSLGPIKTHRGLGYSIYVGE